MWNIESFTWVVMVKWCFHRLRSDNQMSDFYIKHMTIAHNEKRWDDRRNYALMA